MEGDLLTYDADCESSPEAQWERLSRDGLFTKCLSTTVIAHQCNFVSKGARGLAKALFAAFPEVRETLGCIRLRWIHNLPVHLSCATGCVLMLIAPTSPGLPSPGQHLQASDRRRHARPLCESERKRSLALSGQSADPHPQLRLVVGPHAAHRCPLILRCPSCHQVIHGRVVNMLAQYGPGKCGRGETQAQREAWFQACLDEMHRVLPCTTRTVAFPHLIGCGLAGASWRWCVCNLTPWLRGHAMDA